METSNANPFCWATAESLSTVSATTESYGAEEIVESKVEQEKGKGQDMVLSRNLPELKQDLLHIEAEQGNGENHQEWDR